MARTIHYVGPYSDDEQRYRNLLVQPSGVAKMDYIFFSLHRNGYKTILYSTAPTKNSYFCHYSGSVTHIDTNTKIIYPGTFGGPTLVFKALSRLWSLVQMFFYLLKVKPDEYVLVYHAYQYRFVIKPVLFLRKIKLFFEVEEIYNVLWRKSLRRQVAEMQYLKNASGYIFVNDVIAGQSKLTDKPGVVCYGDYRTRPNMPRTADGFIHLVYSGIIEAGNSGVNYSLNAIRLLSDRYKLHVTGYGDDRSIDLLIDRVKAINEELKREAVFYHGCLDNESFIDLISSFHIGLATFDFGQYESLFMFPSKILIYMRANLTVVGSPLACIEASKLASVVTVTKDNSPSAVADAIRSVDIAAINSARVLNELDERFVKDLRSLFDSN